MHKSNFNSNLKTNQHLCPMLKNRIDPWGNLIKTTARGAWMGNRGILHDEHQNIRRLFKLKAWLICLLEFKNRQRKVMNPGNYTELFFLDEATAFSAGHRPCFECRREDFKRFKSSWIKGNPEYGFGEKVSIQEIDNILHQERMGPHGEKITYEELLKELPDGCFMLYKSRPYVRQGKHLFSWSPFGYGSAETFSENEKVQVLTPKSVVNAFRSGYVPQINPH